MTVPTLSSEEIQNRRSGVGRRSMWGDACDGARPRVRVVVVETPGDGVFHFGYAERYEEALQNLDVDFEIIRLPYFRIGWLTRSLAASVREALEGASAGTSVVFCPGLAELFLPGPHVSHHFSAYRSWCGSRRIRVIPHPWTWSQPRQSLERLSWTDKPDLSLGFMGSTYSQSKLARRITRLPQGFKSWLVQGHLIRSVSLFAWLVEHLGMRAVHAFSFPRLEALEVIKQQQVVRPEAKIEIVATDTGYSGSEEENDRYDVHMMNMTYVFCPRGCENFSFRVYECLKYGRVPVILDTDMALPPEIDWARLALLVRYEEMGRLMDVVAHDHESHSGAYFIERQKLAFDTMRRLADGRWLEDVLREEIAPNSRKLAEDQFIPMI